LTLMPADLVTHFSTNNHQSLTSKTRV